MNLDKNKFNMNLYKNKFKWLIWYLCQKNLIIYFGINMSKFWNYMKTFEKGESPKYPIIDGSAWPPIRMSIFINILAWCCLSCATLYSIAMWFNLSIFPNLGWKLKTPMLYTPMKPKVNINNATPIANNITLQPLNLSDLAPHSTLLLTIVTKPITELMRQLLKWAKKFLKLAS